MEKAIKNNNRIMEKRIYRIVLALMLMLPTIAATAQERVYIKKPLSVEPGTSETNIYFTLSLDGSEADECFVGFQMDIELPNGLEIEYTKAGKPRITLVKPGIYPSYVD